MDDLDAKLLGGLLVFLAVADARSFVRAAQRLDMTQSGVSRAIAKLEERLGARLLDRTSRAVTLTDEGRGLCERVTPLLSGIGDAAAETSRTRSAVRGRLRVNVDPLFARMALAPKLCEFLYENPMMELRLETRDRMGDLVSDGFDLAIRFGVPAPSALIARRLFDARILTVASPLYLARHGKPTHPRDLSSDSHQCIRAIDTMSGKPFDWEFWQGNNVVSVSVNSRLCLTDSSTKLESCLAGFGIAQVIDLGLDKYLSERTLINVFPDWSDERFPLYAYYVSKNYMPQKIRRFIDFVSTLVNGKAGQLTTIPLAASAPGVS